MVFSKKDEPRRDIQQTAKEWRFEKKKTSYPALLIRATDAIKFT